MVGKTEAGSHSKLLPVLSGEKKSMLWSSKSFVNEQKVLKSVIQTEQSGNRLARHCPQPDPLTAEREEAVPSTHSDGGTDRR